MAQHTYCRGKNLRQEPCSHSDALAIVKDLIDGGISRLPDDVRANLHSLEAQLRVLEKFPADVSPGGGDIAPAAGAAKADKEKKKDKHKKKEKESGDKSAKKKADTAGADATAGKKAKRRAEEEAGEEAGKKKKSKKDGAGGA